MAAPKTVYLGDLLKMLRAMLSVAIVAAVTTASPASAYTVKGAVPCKSILEEHKNENYRAMNRWWLLGYFTARNYVDDANVGQGVDEMDVYNAAYIFCQENTNLDWDDAAIFIYDRYSR